VPEAGRLPDGRPFYAMKRVRGRRLDEWRASGPPRQAVLRLFQNVCEAMAFAHAHGVIHRDLKPQNVMVGEFGEALVMDWGVAKALGERGTGEVGAGDAAGTTRASGATAHGAVVGTPEFMAPEQARGETDRLDERTDVYALGALLFFLLSGRAPAAARAADRAIPKPLAAICAKAMAPAPGDRYASATEIVADVERFLDGEPVRAHRENAVERAGRVLGRNRTLVALLVAYLVMRAVVFYATGR
jgi:serine/threonine protein kinase